MCILLTIIRPHGLSHSQSQSEPERSSYSDPEAAIQAKSARPQALSRPGSFPGWLLVTASTSFNLLVWPQVIACLCLHLHTVVDLDISDVNGAQAHRLRS